MGRYVARKLVQKMLCNNIDVANSTVGILGVTFKENCPDIRNSKVVDIISELQRWNVNVVVSDPWADPAEVEEVYGISLFKSLSLYSADALVVAVGHNEFRDLDPKTLREYCKGNKPVLVDVKSLYDRDDLRAHGFSIFRL